MTLVYEPLPPAPPTNRPTLDGNVLPASDHIDEITTGFEKMYRFLIKHSERILAADGPLAPLAHQQVRVVFRATNFYKVLLDISLSPDYLQKDKDRGVLLKEVLASNTSPSLWPLLAVERRALEHLDIPRFTAYADDDGLSLDSGERIEHCFVKPSFDVVTDRMKELSDEDLERQLGLIRASLSPNV